MSTSGADCASAGSPPPRSPPSSAHRPTWWTKQIFGPASAPTARALPGVELVYDGKALLSTAVAGWAAAEGVGVGVCSVGELATALAAEVPPSRLILHGAAKTAGELHDAAAASVGRVVIESPSEIALLAGRVRRRQRVLVRVIPDIGTGGHRTIGSGMLDQKFGFALAGGQAAGAVKRVLDQRCLEVVGLHCQLGSQLSDTELYGEAIRQMTAVMAEVRDRHQVVLTELNLGGGHAVPYVSGEPELSVHALAATIDAALESACAEYNYPRPQIVIEPGRAIAARAGMTLYRVIAVRQQPGGRTFVAVDGMSDSPGRVPDGPKYTVALANRLPGNPHRTRHGSGPARRNRRRDRPRRRAGQRHPPRRSARGSLHGRLPSLDGIEQQPGGLPAAGRRDRRPGS